MPARITSSSFPRGPGLRPEWFNDAAQLGDSQVVAVPASTTVPDINARLEAGGSIAGRVTNSAGTAIVGAFVQVRDGTRTLTTTTDSAGRYTFGGLAGFVTIRASAPTAGDLRGHVLAERDRR